MIEGAKRAGAHEEIGGICINAQAFVHVDQYSENPQGTGVMIDPCKKRKEGMDQYKLNSASDFFTQTPMERPQTIGEAQVGFTREQKKHEEKFL